MIPKSPSRRRPRRTPAVGRPAHLQVREQLFELLLRVVREDKLGQSALIHMFKLTQPRASNLAHRHVDKFNTDTLIDMLARVGVRVDVAASTRDRYRRWDFGEKARKIHPIRPVETLHAVERLSGVAQLADWRSQER
jgi:predicted XRE-type DNA-binding protein